MGWGQVGHGHFDWQALDAGREVQGGPGNFDAIVNAVHREAAGFLLPYAEAFDDESWHYSQVGREMALLAGRERDGTTRR